MSATEPDLVARLSQTAIGDPIDGQPSPGYVTLAPQSHSSDPAPSKSVESLLAQDAAVLEAIFRTDDLPLGTRAWSPYLPFLSWLISSLDADLTVDLGFEVDSTFQGVWRAAQGNQSLHKLVTVLLAPASQSDQERQTRVQQLNEIVAEAATRFGGTVEGVVENVEGGVDEDREVVTTEFPPIHLLHLRLSDTSRITQYAQKWITRLAPGAVLVVTATEGVGDHEFATTRRFVTDRLPSTTVGLGPNAEVLVAQVPEDGSTPLVDLLQDAPTAFRGLFALFAERSEFRHLLGPEPVSPSAVRAFIDSLKDTRQSEQETFQTALHASRETMAALATESGMLRSELIEYKEQTQLEKTIMQKEYFGRLDELTAKLSTSAARYTRELAVQELALAARERQAEVLAGEAAEAQRRVAELLQSSSWRMTAPIRLLSRLLGSGRAGDASTQRA